jgi:hypothetical protein
MTAAQVRPGDMVFGTDRMRRSEPGSQAAVLLTIPKCRGQRAFRPSECLRIAAHLFPASSTVGRRRRPSPTAGRDIRFTPSHALSQCMDALDQLPISLINNRRVNYHRIRVGEVSQQDTGRIGARSGNSVVQAQPVMGMTKNGIDQSFRDRVVKRSGDLVDIEA